MDVYDFPFFTIDTKNPATGFNATMGGSWQFSVPPTDPDQRIFTLHYPTMKYFLDENGALIANHSDPQLQQINMYALSLFYQAHKLYDPFQFKHPIWGTMVCRFNSPLAEPEGLPGGKGATKDFTVELIEVP